MEDMKDFIIRMENNYKCSEFFKQKMRETVERAFKIENDFSTKISILNEIEETYARHSANQKNLENLKGQFRTFNEQLSLKEMSDKSSVSSGNSTRFDLSLD